MNTIEIMLEALKSAQRLLAGLPVDKQLTKAIALGEAELRREPDAWGMPDAKRNIVDTITALDKTGEMKLWEDQYSIPLYTREEIK